MELQQIINRFKNNITDSTCNYIQYELIKNNDRTVVYLYQCSICHLFFEMPDYVLGNNKCRCCAHDEYLKIRMHTYIKYNIM